MTAEISETSIGLAEASGATSLLDRLSRSPMVLWPLIIGASLLAGVVVAVIGLFPLLGVGVALFSGWLVWKYPPMAAYMMVALAPTIVGFNRGQLLPVLRPNEALLFFFCGILGLRWLAHSRRISIRLRSVDFAMLALLACGAVLPLAVQLIRQRPLPVDDIFYASVFLRLSLLYYLFRTTITTARQLKVAISLSLVTASLMGILGTAGALNLFGLGEILHDAFPRGVNFEFSKGRGSALIANPIGYGVYQGINACLAIALVLYKQEPRRWLAVAAVCCTVGLFGSAQFGPLLAFIFGLGCLAVATKNVGYLLKRAVPLLLVASIVIVPLFAPRLQKLTNGSALPSEQRERIQQNVEPTDQGRELYRANPGSSWDVRLYNLRVLFLPKFTSASDWVWGVQPQARVRAPPTGKEFAWIESGFLWLFWSGGIPLFLAWNALLLSAGATAVRLLRAGRNFVGAFGGAMIGVVALVAIAQIFDPHVTLRGTVDVFYPVLALLMTARVSRAEFVDFVTGSSE